jgi:DNA polymerase-3 subunit alpha
MVRLERLFFFIAMTEFTNLRVHSYYSILRGTCAVETLVDRAASDNMRSLALTDEGVLYGAVRFDHACRQAGIKPLIGLTLQINSPIQGTIVQADGNPGGTMVVLATNPAGYRSLCRLSSHLMGGGMEAPDPRCALPWEFLIAEREGLIAIEAGRDGLLAKILGHHNPTKAGEYLSRFGGAFKDFGYVGIDVHQAQDRDLMSQFELLADRFGLPLVALQPVYTTKPRAGLDFRLGVAIEHNCRLNEVRPEWLPDGGNPTIDLSWMDQNALRQAYDQLPAALENTTKVAARCADCLPGGQPLWPALSLPNDRTPDEEVAHQSDLGLGKRYSASEHSTARARLQKELAAIARHGFAPFFLVVADIARYARQQNIPISTRGSIANSIVAYCLEITTVDPLDHDLLFERFLNPARTSLPDIDLDFCSRRRDEVLDYVRRTYGEDKVALVGTVSTMRPKSAVRLTAKAYGYPEEELPSILDRLPGGWHPDPRRRDNRKMAEIIDQFEGQAQEIVASAAELVGNPHHLSVHPGGVVICPGAATDILPLQLAPKGFLITQYDHHDVEAIGLPKLDLLGIRALTVLSDATESVRSKDPGFDIESIDTADPATGTLLTHGDTIGVFQCDSEGARGTLRKLNARTIPDLAVANAFFKPGPATGGMADAFVRRYRGEEEVSYLHPSLEPILRQTKGVLLFQEQILRVATEIAGLSWAQAERLRKGMSKFKPEEMQTLQAGFIQGCMRPPPEGPGFTQVQAETLWDQVEAFAGYGFNHGHALAYAGVSYRSAFLKAHFPMEFLTARLANYGGYHHPAVYMAEARRYGFEIRPPHVNYSRRRFTSARIDSHDVLFVGLGWVRDLHKSTHKAIIRERQWQPFDSLRDFLSRVPAMDRETENLVKAGAFDGLGDSRAQLIQDLVSIQRAGNPLQQSFGFYSPSKVEPESPSQIFHWEMDLLGLPISVHPLEIVSSALGEVTPLSALSGLKTCDVRVAGACLPGWGGGSRGFLLSDVTNFIQVHLDQRRIRRSQRIPAWTPLLLEGRWKRDSWGGGRLEVARFETLPVLKPTETH